MKTLPGPGWQRLDVIQLRYANQDWDTVHGKLTNTKGFANTWR